MLFAMYFSHTSSTYFIPSILSKGQITTEKDWKLVLFIGHWIFFPIITSQMAICHSVSTSFIEKKFGLQRIFEFSSWMRILINTHGPAELSLANSEPYEWRHLSNLMWQQKKSVWSDSSTNLLNRSLFCIQQGITTPTKNLILLIFMIHSRMCYISVIFGDFCFSHSAYFLIHFIEQNRSWCNFIELTVLDFLRIKHSLSMIYYWI